MSSLVINDQDRVFFKFNKDSTNFLGFGIDNMLNYVFSKERPNPLKNFVAKIYAIKGELHTISAKTWKDASTDPMDNNQYFVFEKMMTYLKKGTVKLKSSKKCAYDTTYANVIGKKKMSAFKSLMAQGVCYGKKNRLIYNSLAIDPRLIVKKGMMKSVDIL